MSTVQCLHVLTCNGMSGQLNTVLALQEINKRLTCVIHNICSSFSYTWHMYI